MPSERVQRQIDHLLDQIEAAAGSLDWSKVQELADGVLRLDPENEDARSFLNAAGRDTGLQNTASSSSVKSVPDVSGRQEPRAALQPTSFANGRYTVSKFLGEGGKKQVFLARDSLLDRDVAFALIKTEGLDEASRVRVQREAQAMGRLGAHPHIVTVFDIGEENGQPYLVLPVLAAVTSRA